MQRVRVFSFKHLVKQIDELLVFLPIRHGCYSPEYFVVVAHFRYEVELPILIVRPHEIPQRLLFLLQFVFGSLFLHHPAN